MSDDHPPFAIEPLKRSDLPAVLELQAQAYPPFLRETEEAFLSRMALSTPCCLAARRGRELLGYLIAHGWRGRSPPPVGTVLADSVASEVLFIHDLTVSRSQRGQGVGEQLIARAFEMAARKGLPSAELIAVEGAADYWRRLGFREEPVTGELLEKVRTYGDLARWMTREVPTRESA